MKKLILFASLLLAVHAPAEEGEGLLDPSPPKGTTPEQIIQKFAAKETEFAHARAQYTYRESVYIAVMDGNTPTGEFAETFDALFDDKNRRIVNMVYAPQSSLEQAGLSLDEEDLKDFEQTQPFVLTSDELPEYNITYVGKQREDELDTYVFDIKPREIDKKKRRFQGRVWVDDQDFQIVKVFGKGVSSKNFEKGHAFPDFTTYRQQIDGQYWFPVYTSTNDVLHFPGGRGALEQDVHLKGVTKYSNYKRFGTKTRIIYEGQQLPTTPQPPGQQPQPQTPPPKN